MHEEINFPSIFMIKKALLLYIFEGYFNPVISQVVCLVKVLESVVLLIWLEKQNLKGYGSSLIISILWNYKIYDINLIKQHRIHYMKCVFLSKMSEKLSQTPAPS
jgi:hypothetical protein